MTFTKYIKEIYEEKHSKNPRFSLRAFAKVLGISSGRLSEILDGKAGVTKRTAANIASKLKLKDNETSYLINLSIAEFSTNKEEVKNAKYEIIKSEYKKIQTDHEDIYEILSGWHNFAILELSHLEKLNINNIGKISEIFEIPNEEVKESIERLLRNKLITVDKKGFIKDNNKFLATPDGVPNKAIRECHKKLLLKAIQAIDSQSTEKRESKALVLSLNTNDIENIKTDVDKYLDLLSRKINKSKNKSRVYAISFNLFDLMK